MSGFPIPSDGLDDRLSIVGTAGSGKTYSAGLCVERLLASGARVVVPDPLGVWFGIALDQDGKNPSPWRAKGNLIVFGGEHGDLPLNEQAGAIIGETVAKMAESVVLDLSDLGTKAAERRFMLAFLTALNRHANGEPVHIVFDEADLWAPQQILDKDGEATKLKGMMEQVVRRGRIKGFIPWLITQRPAVLSKDVLSQADGLIALKLTSSQDRDAIGAWIEGQADRETGKAMLASLPTMQRGQGVVWLPGRGVLTTATFPTKITFDSSRTPARGERRERRDLKPLDLGGLKERLASIEAEAKANDPKALRAAVADLTRRLAKAEKAVPVATPPEPTDKIALDQARAEGHRAGIAIGLARALEAVKGCRVEPSQAVSSAADPRAPRSKPVEITADGSVPAGCAKPLAALAGVYPAGMTEPQWATAAGYKRSGGTWGTYKSRLRGAGLIESREGRWFATEAGARAVGDVELPPSPGADLVRWWASKLPGTTKAAEALIEAWPNGLSRDDLAARLDMSAAGGSFGTYLSRLAGPGIITRDGGMIRLSPDVMEAA